MSETGSNRNMLLALVAVVAIAAVAVGYLLGRTSSAPAAPGDQIAAPIAALSAEAREPSTEPRQPVEPELSDPAPAGPEPGARRAQSPTPRRTGPAEEKRSEPTRVDDAPPEMGEREPDVAPPPPAPAPPPAPIPVTVGAGTKITLELLSPVSSQTATVGQQVRARVVETIRVDGRAAIPAGATATGRVSEAKALRKVGGQAHLAIAFDRLERDGGSVPLEAYWARTGKSETGKDAATIAAGAVIGTVLGNQAKKNDRGRAIGAIVGAGVGTAIAASTEGETVELANGDVLELTLRSDVELLLRP